MLIAIDGASKRNGKPDCHAAGSAVCPEQGLIFAKSEMGSTNQRGEILGLFCGLDMMRRLHASHGEEHFILVTDSEYIFNAMYNEWFDGWSRNDWVTASGTPVKNKDLWVNVLHDVAGLQICGVEITPVHIKGHLVSLGEVTASKLLDEDSTGAKLIEAAILKYEVRKQSHAHMFENAYELFKRNNGGMVPEDVFKKFVTANTLADYSATKYLAIQEANQQRVDKDKELEKLLGITQD